MRLDEILCGITPLPWKIGTYEHGAAYTFSVPDERYIVHAANAFPKLVEFAQSVRCKCVEYGPEGEIYKRERPCPRCAVLAIALNRDENRPMTPEQKADLLDWAETLLCNAVPMPHCGQEEWDKIVRKWRDEKHGIAKTDAKPTTELALKKLKTTESAKDQERQIP